MLELMRETALAHVEIMPGSSPVMPAHYFLASGHFPVMPGKVSTMFRELFSRPREPFSRSGRQFLRPGHLKAMWARWLVSCASARRLIPRKLVTAQIAPKAASRTFGRIVQNIGRIVQRFDHSAALSLVLVKHERTIHEQERASNLEQTR